MRQTGAPARWIVATGVMILAVAGMAGTAAADDEEVRLSPYRAGPGADLRITAYDCQGPAFARSDAFQEEPELEDDDSGVAVGWAQVDYGARSGPYTVEVDCQGDGGTIYGAFYVVDGYGPNTGGGGLALARGAARAAESGKTLPEGAPDAGGGAVSAPVADPAGGARPGPSLGWEAGGVAALAGAGALALMRRRRAGRRG